MNVRRLPFFACFFFLLSMACLVVWARFASDPQVSPSGLGHTRELVALIGTGGFFALSLGCVLAITRKLEDKRGNSPQ